MIPRRPGVVSALGGLIADVKNDFIRTLFLELDGEHLPLPDASVDSALSTWTLCTIPDAGAALREMHRVLRPGGRLHFVEHGRAPDRRTARRQARLTPLQRRIAGGCHLDRPIDELIEAAGFRIERLDTYVGAGQVETLVEPVSILDKDAFAREVAAVEDPRAKAEVIANRVRRTIHEHLDEDPVFYKRFSAA